jgi:hypothetical protein
MSAGAGVAPIRRFTLLLAGLACVLVGAFGAAPLGTAPRTARAPLPPASGATTLRAAASAMGGSWRESQVRLYATVHDVVIVGASARAERVRLFHEAHPGMRVLAYTAGFDVDEAAPLFAWIRERHPDWFLRDGGGRPVHTYRTPRRWALDCGRADVRAFFADSARRRVRELGADGIFEDNVFPSWRYPNLAGNAARLERYATPAEWRAALEAYLAALEAAVAPGVVAANECEPWSRHARIVAVEQLPRGGRAWEERVRGFAALASDPSRVPCLLQRLSGPDDPARAFAAASYLMAVGPGALIGFDWPGPRESRRVLPEYRLALGRPLGAAQRTGGVWWRDFERARVLVNPTGSERAAPWPAWRPGRRALPPLSAGIAWRAGATHAQLPFWLTP